MSLREYARKRRFDRTPEPSGDAAGAGNRRPRFVVQLHHARARHYDFRLEVDGVLRSWAVPKGPSLRPGERRLAVEVEDHPLDYASFEGDIPAGNYGAGHVQIFDQGHWSCEGDPLPALAAGKLDFSLDGGKLAGAWKLIRTRPSGRQRQWLLIKRDDHHAADLDADALVAAAGTGNAAAAGRNPKVPANKAGKVAAAKAGASRRTQATGSTARAGPWRARARALAGTQAGAMPVGFKPQLAMLRSTPPAGDTWLHEIKWDGYRLLVDLVKGKATLRSRGGLDWSDTFPGLAKAIASLPVQDACLDGELVVLDAAGRADFPALQRAIEGRSQAQLRYIVFDLPGMAGIDLTACALEDRKALLADLLAESPDELAYGDHIVGHGAQVHKATAEQGVEGVVSKRLGSPYRDGRGGDWIKSKHESSDEFVVVGHTAPKGARTGFGSLLMATRDNGRWRYVGRVGTGYDDATLKQLHTRLQALARSEPVLELPAHVPFSARSVRWVEPRLVAEVAFRGWGKEGLLRQAAFKRLRIDKVAADVVAAIDRTEEAAVVISHPDRTMFADAAYTKRDVADYYQAVARWLLPEVGGRPLSLLRCPDGSRGDCFFQKHHADSLGSHVKSVDIKQKSGIAQYLWIDSVEGLIELVQMNTLELHPWGARVDDPEQPDRLVFDLDPGPGIGWPTVVEAAREVRDRLRDAGLASAVRLSGGKGLHVVAAITRGPGWDEVRDFCQAFATAMATQSPTGYVATMSKAIRRDRIFIDWLRNGRGATSIASWSLRARAGAPVAVPLRWADLGGIAAPDAFDLKLAQARAGRIRVDPWARDVDEAQTLPAFE
jgi:bifunctional non-homologous end joining protein LigD